MVVNAGVTLALNEPFGIAGIEIGTVAGTLVMTVAQGWILRRELGGIDGARTSSAMIRMLIAAGILAAASDLAWLGLDELLGHALFAQIAAVGGGVAAGVLVYAVAVWALRIPEARQVARLIRSRAG
jgi:putative peptidoglycan lipid II flippase